MARFARIQRNDRSTRIRRARVITLAPSGRVAMIERYVGGRRFVSVPGGKLEPGETPEQAAVREIEEELGLRVHLSGRLPDLNGQAYFLAVVPEEGELRLSGPELRKQTRSNRYTPRWIDAATMGALPLRQAAVRPLIEAAALAVSATVAMNTTEDGDNGLVPVAPQPVSAVLKVPVVLAQRRLPRRRFSFRGRGRIGVKE